jgi:hypothetical protein
LSFRWGTLRTFRPSDESQLLRLGRDLPDEDVPCAMEVNARESTFKLAAISGGLVEDRREEGRQQVDDLYDLVTAMLVLSVIGGANETLGQVRQWREYRQSENDREQRPDRNFAEFKRDLQRVVALADRADGALASMSISLDVCAQLIDESGDDLASSIPFAAAYKLRVRFEDRRRYKREVQELLRSLQILAGTLDDLAGVVWKLSPQQSPDQTRRAAQLAVEEDSAFSNALVLLGQRETTFADAVEVARKTMTNARQYLALLRDEAFGAGDS